MNTKFLAWTKRKYGKHGEVKSTRGNEHDLLGMLMNFKINGKVTVDMSKYMKKMVEDFEKKYTLNNTATTPATNDLFGRDEDSPKIEKEMAEDFHTFMAKGLFAFKCARPDTATSISVLMTRVRSPSVEDWGKLVRYCLLYTSPSPRDATLSRMPSSA